MIFYQMLQYYGAEEHCEAEWGLNSRQGMENNRNRLTHNSLNKSVIYVYMSLGVLRYEIKALLLLLFQSNCN